MSVALLEAYNIFCLTLESSGDQLMRIHRKVLPDLSSNLKGGDN